MSDSGQFHRGFRRVVGRALDELARADELQEEQLADHEKRLAEIEPLYRVMWWFLVTFGGALVTGIGTGVAVWVMR